MAANDYSEILRVTCGLMGQLPSRLQTEDWNTLRSFAEFRLRAAWESEYWPDVMRMERRTFRNEWLATKAYVTGDEVYYTPAQTYYCAIRASTNEAPASGVSDTLNSAYWAVSRNSYSNAEYDNATAYTSGGQVFYGATGRSYQCHTASTGNLPTNASYWGRLTEFDPVIAYAQTADALPVTSVTRSGTTATVTTSTNHRLQPGDTVDIAGAGQTDYNGRFVITLTGDTTFTFSVANSPTTPATGTITVTPVVTPLGEVFEVNNANRYLTGTWREYETRRSVTGVQCLGASGVVWVGFRRVAPVLIGDTYDATTAYTAGQQVYFESGGVGNFHDCVAATTAGQSPSTHAGKWARVVIPLRFAPYLSRALFADWLTSQGQADKAGYYEQWAGALLAEEADKLYRQQGQQQRLRVQTY